MLQKSFPAIAQGGNSTGLESNECGSQDSDEDGSEGSNEEVSLEFMDVLVQTFLSILPHVSGPTCFTIEQASIFITCFSRKFGIFWSYMS
jgi:DNA polymerase phi